jgi:hypothetical protein
MLEDGPLIAIYKIWLVDREEVEVNVPAEVIVNPSLLKEVTLAVEILFVAFSYIAKHLSL